MTHSSSPADVLPRGWDARLSEAADELHSVSHQKEVEYNHMLG